MTNRSYYFDVPTSQDPGVNEKMTSIMEKHLLPSEQDNVVFGNDYPDRDVFYTFWPPYKVEAIIRDLDALGIPYTWQDITEDLLMGRLNNDPDFADTFILKDGMDEAQASLVKRDQEILRRFVKENLTADMVLDKMNEQGSITELDQEILNKI